MQRETMQINNGWLTTASQCPSPNFNERPADTEISLLVIHNISLPAGYFGGPYIEQLFTNCLDTNADPSFCILQGLEVSAHLFIRRDGSVIQFVPFHRRAWHAGISRWHGRDNCNDFSIGIELEGTDTVPYEERQYQVLAAITRLLMATWPALTVNNIAGHSDIAPDRKTDPGKAFDWDYYSSLIG